jgi:adenylate cyclase
MHKEIERKFLVKNNSFKDLATPVYIQQGFLNSEKERVVRIRIADRKAFLTIKGISSGASRSEFEYEIPVNEAIYMLEELCEKPIIKKYRYKIPWGDLNWEVDEFLELNEGLIIAEIELQHEDQKFQLPVWIGKEVTSDKKYYNSNLIKFPYALWDKL